MPLRIACDGESASGKSLASKLIGSKFACFVLNSGLIYRFASYLKFKIPKLKDVDILGPVDTPIFKLKKKYRSRILIRYPKKLFIQKYFSSIIKNLKFPNGVKLGVDVDPINFS